METIYVIKFDNYHGETDFEFFHYKDNAKRRYNELLKENRDKDEFKYYYNNNEQGFSFFDADYNEFSTYISFVETSLNNLFSD